MRMDMNMYKIKHAYSKTLLYSVTYKTCLKNLLKRNFLTLYHKIKKKHVNYIIEIDLNILTSVNVPNNIQYK